MQPVQYELFKHAEQVSGQLKQDFDISKGYVAFGQVVTQVKLDIIIKYPDLHEVH